MALVGTVGRMTWFTKAARARTRNGGCCIDVALLRGHDDWEGRVMRGASGRSGHHSVCNYDRVI
jgi:hypothetical protein